MKPFPALLIIISLALVIAQPGVARANASQTATPPLMESGSARLRVWFWSIYDSRLLTPGGEYQGIQPPLVLEITYRRDIPAKELLQQTDKAWQRLGVSEEQRQQWLARLAELWPDVKQGDTLSLHWYSLERADFYQDQRLLGSLRSNQMAERFLAIWLSPQTSHPDIREQLIGQTP